MSQTEAIRRALYQEDGLSRRALRAQETQAQMFSPRRILVSLMMLPILAVSVATSIYIRTSDYDPPAALAHLVARGGCDAAQYVGLAPAYQGALGYHAHNDINNDGVACDGADVVTEVPVQEAAYDAPQPTIATEARIISGAKFLKP